MATAIGCAGPGRCRKMLALPDVLNQLAGGKPRPTMIVTLFAWVVAALPRTQCRAVDKILAVGGKLREGGGGVANVLVLYTPRGGQPTC